MPATTENAPRLADPCEVNFQQPEPAEMATTPEEPWLQVLSSRHFPAWLAEQRLSLAFTTYQAGKLLLLGLQPDGRVSVFERTFNRCMGLYGDGQTLWLSSIFQLWRFENALAPGELHNGADRLYVPRVGYTTGDLDIHDIAVESSGRVVFVNTRFGCLATLSDQSSFTPLWRPPFLSKLAPEDRCHLNGLALEDGKARYVTAVSVSDVADGWRDRRRDGGVVIDVQTNEIIATGLSMPHSPRVYRGKLWLLNAGTGYFGSIDLASGKFEPLTFCPGFLRGLAFAGVRHRWSVRAAARHDNVRRAAAGRRADTARSRTPQRPARDRPAQWRRRPLGASGRNDQRTVRRGGAAGSGPTKGTRLQNG